jgi:5-methylcytosine-specific restriction endonuclease McrA
MSVKPCIERPDGRACVEYTVPSKSRCEMHQRQFDREHVTPSSTITWTAKWKRIRAKLIRDRRRTDGRWRCQICGLLIVDVGDIEVDHRVPVSEDPSLAWEVTNLRVTHRRCNRSRPRPRRAAREVVR